MKTEETVSLGFAAEVLLTCLLFDLSSIAAAQSVFTNVYLAGVPGVYQSSVAWGDYDNDGRLDFLLTGQTNSLVVVPELSSISQLWRNTGSGFSNVTENVFPTNGLPQIEGGSVAWGDYDNDGHLDFLITGFDNVSHQWTAQLWRNTGSGFTNMTASLAPELPGVYESSVAWGDYDNDGRLDFLITGTTNGLSAISQLWRNTGSGFVNVTANVAPGLPGVGHSSVAWGDYNNDGRLDLLLTGRETIPISQIWQNTGSGFTNVTANVAPGLPQVDWCSAAWGDYDNDGHLDFVITGTADFASGLCQLWRNTGSGFTNVPIADLIGAFFSSVAWADYDNDGHLDLFITGTSNFFSDLGNISQLWRNNGDATFSNVTATILPPELAQLTMGSVAWGDYDNDGRLDFLLTGSPDFSGSTAQLWRNVTPVTNAPPGAPTGLALTSTTNAVMLSWNSASDDHTPASGLTYNVRAGTSPGGIDLFAGHVDATNGFRRVPAIGNVYLRHSLPLTGLTHGETVYWSVQAVDTSFAGGPFATETSVVTIPHLTITPVTATNAIMSWTPPTFGWHLEETPVLNPATWTDSPSGELNPVTVSATNPATWYRLKNE